MIKNILFNKLIWGVLLMLFFSSSALAQETYINFTNNPDDVLLKGMGQFFGTDGTNINAESGFSLTMQAMILAVLSPSIGAIIIYSIIHLITNTAGSGKVAVKDLGYLWLGKSVLGFALIFPTSTGWPAICMLVYYFFTFSVSLGGSMGNTFINNAPKNIIYNNEYSYSRLYPLLSKMVNANRCVLESNKYVEKMRTQGSLESFLSSVSSKRTVPSFSSTTATVVSGKETHFMISYGDKSGTFKIGRNLCSVVDYVLTTKSNDIDLSDNVLDSSNAPALEVIKTRFNQIHQQQLIELDKKAKQLAMYQMSDSFDLESYKSAFASAVQTYGSALQEAGNSLAQQYINTNNYSDIMKMGPSMYGTLPASMGIIQGSIQQAKDTLPEVSGVAVNNNGLKETGFGPVIIGSINASDNINNEVIGMIEPSRAIMKGDPQLTDADESTFTRLVVGPFADLINFQYLAKPANYMANPLFTSQQMGYEIIHGITGLSARFITLGLVTVPIPGISLFISWVGNSVVTPMIVGLLLPAVTLAYVVPLIPVVAWVGVVAGWCLGLIRSMFVMVLGLLTLMYPDPQGFVGKSGQLYLVLLEDMLRIPLSVAGLFLGWNLMPIIHYYITLNFTAVFNTNLTGFDGVTAGITNLIVYTLVTYGNIKACIALSSTLPDITLSLLGRTSQLMSSSVQEVSGAGDKAAGGLAQTTQAVATGIIARSPIGASTGKNKFQQHLRPGGSSSSLDFDGENRKKFGRKREN
ncbi:hypothetical protein SS41_23165 [Enterobacter hormaechei subsp. xiangfangensis]|uniref:DotA/TraY family protein n=1 Tax=Enterobacter hormaechei TaxID=158836 RepID=UPI0005EDBF4E|nr:DotA/TraY family protein [Enterobacter hormaechei]KJN19157.1 hypothetical protein SS41_23165 [Enterobacter hormaechei subsp. xiangfangensis]